MDPLKIGLSAEVIAKVQGCFSRVPNIHQVILYGSRAKGNYRTGSDIDLCLVGDSLNPATLLQLSNDLDELMLPYTFDLSIHHQIDSPNLKEHIDRVGLVFFER